VKPWKVLEQNIVFDNPYLKVRQERVQLATGAVIDDFHVLQSATWAAAVALTSQRELVLVRQYRHGHGAASLELPAGVMEAGETAEQAAQRELLEETGFSGTAAQHFWTCRPEPARHDQWAHFVFAPQVRKDAGQSLDSTEDIQVELHPIKDLDSVVSEMVHGVHVAALLLAARRGLLD
jgi:8-oxo-dGTP pyrophosphatase MutT (NUDIX family)